MKEEAKKNVSAPALYGFLASPYLVLLEADFLKKAVDYSFFLVLASLCPKGWASSVRVFIDRVDLYAEGVRRGVAQSGQRICFGYRGP